MKAKQQKSVFLSIFLSILRGRARMPMESAGGELAPETPVRRPVLGTCLQTVTRSLHERRSMQTAFGLKSTSRKALFIVFVFFPRMGRDLRLFNNPVPQTCLCR